MTRKQYINHVNKKLKLPKNIKTTILNDLEETFQSAKEHGESEIQIISRLGSPKAFVEDVVRNIDLSTTEKSYFKLEKTVIVTIILFVIMAICATWNIVSDAIFKSNIEGIIISGADGPTQIFVNSSYGDALSISVCVVLWVVPIVLFSYLMYKKKKINK